MPQLHLIRPAYNGPFALLCDSHVVGFAGPYGASLKSSALQRVDMINKNCVIDWNAQTNHEIAEIMVSSGGFG